MQLQNILYNTTYLISISAIFFIAFAIAVRNVTPRYRTFSLFAGVLGVWILLQYIAQLTHTRELLAFRFLQGSVMMSGAVAYTFLMFSTHYFRKSYSIKLSVYFGIPILLLLPFSFSKYSITSAVVNQSGIAVKEAGIAYLIQLVIIAAYILLGIIYVNLKTKKADKYERKRVTLLMLAVGQFAFFGLAASILFADSTLSQLVNPVSGLILVGLVGYAILKHRLFDLRSFVFRAMVYILSVLSIGIIYTVLVYGLGSIFIDVSNISYLQRVFFAFLALLIAMTYSVILRFFNTLTTTIFFRDSYNTQTVLDKVSGVIVGTVDPHKVQRGSLTALSDALRPNYAAFLFVNKSGDIRHGDQAGSQWRIKDEPGLKSVFSKLGKNIVVYDEVDEKKFKFKESLRVEDISLVAPLVTKEETIGHLILGPKKSGNVYTQQDIGLLNIATNELAVALQNAQRFEEIQAFNITLQEKVNEATRELKSTNKKLIELDEAKDEFISMASHQLRTPLTSIKGYLSMLLDGDMGKLGTNQTSALKEAFGSSQRMVFLISDFLNVSRIKTGKFVIEKSEVNLATMVHEELNQLKELAESRNVQFKYEQPKEFPTVMLDDNKIRQVMMNMIDNAIYYTPVGGTVTVQLYVDAKEVIFKVIDTGIGVPKSEQHKLFTKFFRAANARIARPDGTGLGLFMAQKIVLAQGGLIIFESEEGKGSTFGWRFPLKKIKP